MLSDDLWGVCMIIGAEVNGLEVVALLEYPVRGYFQLLLKVEMGVIPVFGVAADTKALLPWRSRCTCVKAGTRAYRGVVSSIGPVISS
jgi:hypothetical protein